MTPRAQQQSPSEQLRDAAPALLAALEACVDFYVSGPSQIDEWAAARDRVIQAARAAIAQAKGEAR